MRRESEDEMSDETKRAQHTALPWTAHRARSLTHIRGAAGPVVASVPVGPNADLIVRAVNSHEDMVAALRGVLRWYATIHGSMPDKLLHAAVTALAKAQP